jgi:hypothetical protein
MEISEFEWLKKMEQRDLFLKWQKVLVCMGVLNISGYET